MVWELIPQVPLCMSESYSECIEALATELGSRRIEIYNNALGLKTPILAQVLIECVLVEACGLWTLDKGCKSTIKEIL